MRSLSATSALACLCIFFAHTRRCVGLLPNHSGHSCMHNHRCLPVNKHLTTYGLEAPCSLLLLLREKSIQWTVCVFIQQLDERFESLTISTSTEQVRNVITQKCSHEVLHWLGTKAMDWGCDKSSAAISAPCFQVFKLLSELWFLCFHEMAWFLWMSILQQTLIALLNWAHNFANESRWFRIESDKVLQKWKVQAVILLFGQFCMWRLLWSGFLWTRSWCL